MIDVFGTEGWLALKKADAESQLAKLGEHKDSAPDIPGLSDIKRQIAKADQRYKMFCRLLSVAKVCNGLSVLLVLVIVLTELVRLVRRPPILATPVSGSAEHVVLVVLLVVVVALLSLNVVTLPTGSLWKKTIVRYIPTTLVVVIAYFAIRGVAPEFGREHVDLLVSLLFSGQALVLSLVDRSR